MPIILPLRNLIVDLKMLVRIAKKLHLMKETRDGYDGFNEMDDSDNFDRKKVPDIEDDDYWLDD